MWFCVGILVGLVIRSCGVELRVFLCSVVVIVRFSWSLVVFCLVFCYVGLFACVDSSEISPRDITKTQNTWWPLVEIAFSPRWFPRHVLLCLQELILYFFCIIHKVCTEHYPDLAQKKDYRSATCLFLVQSNKHYTMKQLCMPHLSLFCNTNNIICFFERVMNWLDQWRPYIFFIVTKIASVMMWE